MSKGEAHKVQSFDSASSFCGPKCSEVLLLYFSQDFVVFGVRFLRIDNRVSLWIVDIIKQGQDLIASCVIIVSCYSFEKLIFWLRPIVCASYKNSHICN